MGPPPTPPSTSNPHGIQGLLPRKRGDKREKWAPQGKKIVSPNKCVNNSIVKERGKWKDKGKGRERGTGKGSGRMGEEKIALAHDETHETWTNYSFH